MQTHSPFRSAWVITFLIAALTGKAQNEPTLAIQMHPAITVVGEAGSTYVIESKNGVDDDWWLTRGVVELTSTQAQWMDSVPAEGPKRIYRAVKVTKPEGVQPVEGMVWIPSGRFTMGSPESERGRRESEGPQTRVTLTKSFWMSEHEVTQGEYEALMGSNPSYFNGVRGETDYGTDHSRPVEQVSWNKAVAYCGALTEQERTAGHLAEGWEYRLPTDAEWEYGCRAGTCVDVGWAITAQDPVTLTGWRQLAEALHRTGKSDRAFELLRNQIHRHQDNADIHYDLARYQAAAGELDHAVSLLKMAIDLAGDEAMNERARTDPELNEVMLRMNAGPGQ